MSKKHPPPVPRELAEFEEADGERSPLMEPEQHALAEEEEEDQLRDVRKSPAADFGSKHIGAVIIPLELTQSIGRIISGTKGLECTKEF